MDYFVCTSTGNDENVGTKEKPFKTIYAASKLAGPGDTINIEAGIYRERIVPVQGGTRNNVELLLFSSKFLRQNHIVTVVSQFCC